MSIRPLIQAASLTLWALCLVTTWATGVVNGVAVLMVLFLVVFCWSAGAFTRRFWIADDETSARLTAVDEELDFMESVRADIARMDDDRRR